MEEKEEEIEEKEEEEIEEKEEEELPWCVHLSFSLSLCQTLQCNSHSCSFPQVADCCLFSVPFFFLTFQPPAPPTPSLAIFSPTTAWLNLALHRVPGAAEKPEVCKAAWPVEDRCSGNSRTLCCPLIPPHGKRRLKKLLCFKHSTMAQFAPPGGAQPHGRACFCYELVGN